MKEKLYVSQRKAIRFVLDKDSMYHLEFNDFKNAGFLPLDYRVMLLKANHMYKIFNNIAPQYLLDNFAKKSLVQYPRGCENNFEKLFYCSSGQKTFKCTGTNIWNKLPDAIKLCNNFSCFKKEAKKYFCLEFKKSCQSEFVY